MIMSHSEVGQLRLDERIRAITQVRDRLASELQEAAGWR